MEGRCKYSIGLNYTHNFNVPFLLIAPQLCLDCMRCNVGTFVEDRQYKS